MDEMQDEFLKEEVRDGFLVTGRRKQLWAMELEMIEEFQRICARNGLTYYAVGGTLLGAVRHGGFIPWDDDVDLAMPREDFEKFIAAAKNELNEKYFLQTPDTDPGYYYGHLKIRMNGTTCIRRSEWPHRMPFHQGAFIDVFPLDAVPDGERAMRRHKRLVRFFHVVCTSAPYDLRAGGIRHKLRFRLCHMLLVLIRPIHFAHWRDRAAQRYDGERTRRIGQLTQCYKRPECIWPREIFGEPAELPFESIVLAAPADYEAELDREFGDWRTPKNTAGQHGEVFFDPDRSYAEYLSRPKNDNRIEECGL